MTNDELHKLVQSQIAVLRSTADAIQAVIDSLDLAAISLPGQKQNILMIADEMEKWESK